MRFFSKIAAATAVAGLAMFGTVAASAGMANAATDASMTGCDTGSSGLLALNVFPTCTAKNSTVVSPTSITVTADPSFFNTLGAVPGIKALLTLLGQSLAENVSYTLSCSVNGHAVTKAESFQATSVATSTQVVDLQSAVGSPVPNSCTVEDLQATSLVSLSTPLLLLLGSTHFDFGVAATANTTVPGAIWMAAAKTSDGLPADICSDAVNNGNAGAKVQVFQCNSDLAQYWVQASTHQLVHNGACLTESGSKMVLAQCSPTSNAQVWTVKGTGGAFNTIVNKSTGHCLTASKATNGTQLTGTACAGKANQKWTGPATSPK